MVNLGCIFICEFCLKFKKSRTSLYRHSVSINFFLIISINYYILCITDKM